MLRILIVEDDARIANFLARAFTAKGYTVEAAADGTQALRLAHSRQYDAVLLDLMLPGMSGAAVLKELAAASPELPVVVVSAVSEASAKVRCLELGAADYVVKPFELAELIARVRARMRRPAQELERPVRVRRAGPILLDLERRTADGVHGRVPLTAREFRLLEHLMERDGGVATREELLSQVWGFSFDPGTNVVDVYVGRLRSKLGSDAIETVRGVGYALAADGAGGAAEPHVLEPPARRPASRGAARVPDSAEATPAGRPRLAQAPSGAASTTPRCQGPRARDGEVRRDQGRRRAVDRPSSQSSPRRSQGKLLG